MAWYNNLFNRRTFRLTETQREQIVRVFGSFKANQMVMDDQSYLEQGYEKNIDVYSVIKKIADVGSSTNWILEREIAKDEWEPVTDTPLNKFLSNPNPTKGYTFEDILFQSYVYLLASGNAYLYGIVPEGFSEFGEIDVLPSPFVTPYSSGDFFLPEIKYQFSLDKTNKTIPGDSMMHVKFFNPSYSSVTESICGLSPIQVAAAAVQVGNDRWEADANLLQNRGAIGMITDASQVPMNEKQAKEVQEKFDGDIGGPEKFNKIRVTNKDLKFIQFAMSSSDLQLIEKGVVTLRSICNVYGIDSSLFNDPANKTYNNRLEAQKSFYTDVIIPLNKKFKHHLNRYLVSSFFPMGGYRMRPDYSEVEALHEDFHQKSTTYVSMKNAGIISANTAARALGQPESDDPNAEKLIVTNNLIPLSQLGGNENDNQL